MTPKPDTAEWERWILTDESWAQWRAENSDLVADMRARTTTDTARDAPRSPDCVAGKHRACGGDAWDDAADDVCDCRCGCHSEEVAADER
ncbi:hypothetical protein [Microbacterium halotolerans]|uniref:hypothetical protein n=1 Tax=Microbacterium halotolerans TaxID=246613 RepID=UPI001968E2C1|nr:hypothetical protein [Microbacterium halotolerans]